MTEQEWLTSTDPCAMLRAVTPAPSERKLRLFACAVTRRMWDRLHTDSRGAVWAAEYFADGKATHDQLMAALDGARSCWKNPDSAAGFAVYCCNNHVWYAVNRITSRELTDVPSQGDMADIIRDIFGNPYRPDRAAEKSAPWLTPTVLSLARTAYEERPRGGSLDSARLSVLGDALEEAGCTDKHLLHHLRGKEELITNDRQCPIDGAECETVQHYLQGNLTMGYVCTLPFEERKPPHSWVMPQAGKRIWRTRRGPHARGCWAVDLITQPEG